MSCLSCLNRFCGFMLSAMTGVFLGNFVIELNKNTKKETEWERKRRERCLRRIRGEFED